jgi:hypothetical protein
MALTVEQDTERSDVTTSERSMSVFNLEMLGGRTHWTVWNLRYRSPMGSSLSRPL